MTSPQALGGHARAKAMTAAERREAAQRAAQARWQGSPQANARPISPAKLRRQIDTEVQAIKHRRGQLQQIASQVVDQIKDADAIVAALDQASALLGKL